jgi:hypothetical protein
MVNGEILFRQLDFTVDLFDRSQYQIGCFAPARRLPLMAVVKITLWHSNGFPTNAHVPSGPIFLKAAEDISVLLFTRPCFIACLPDHRNAI